MPLSSNLLMPTLPGANRPRSMAEVLAETMRAQRQFDDSQAMRGAQYIPDSGLGGALLMGLQGIMGARGADKAEGQLADLLRERFDMESAAKQAELRAQADKEDRDYQRELDKIEARERARAENRPKDWKAGVIESLSPEQLKQAGMIELGLAPRAGSGPAPTEAPASIRELQAYLALPEDQRAIYDRLQGRESGPAALSVQGQKELTAQNLKAISADNALGIIDELEKLNKQDVGGRIVGNLPGAAIVDPRIEQYNALTSQLVEEATRLRKIPGIGTQSNMDLQQAMMAIPAAGTNVETRNAALKRLRAVIERVKKESDAAGRRISGAPAVISGSVDATGWGIEDAD